MWLKWGVEDLKKEAITENRENEGAFITVALLSE